MTSELWLGAASFLFPVERKNEACPAMDQKRHPHLSQHGTRPSPAGTPRSPPPEDLVLVGRGGAAPNSICSDNVDTGRCGRVGWGVRGGARSVSHRTNLAGNGCLETLALVLITTRWIGRAGGPVRRRRRLDGRIPCSARWMQRRGTGP